MALSLSTATILEKNRLVSDGAWLILLELNFKGNIIRLVRNTEDIFWNGSTWTAFPFELDDIKEDTDGEIPSLKIKVGNQMRQVQQYIRPIGGGIGCEVILSVVHSKHLDIVEPDLQLNFVVEESSADENWVYFTLGGDIVNSNRFPPRRIIKDFCPFQFKGIECGYAGPFTTCNKTLANCTNLLNSSRFGGEFSLPYEGIYASNS